MAQRRTTKRTTTISRSTPKPPKIAGERSVQRTGRTVSVRPEPRTGPDIAPAAVDRRKQFTGTDERATDRKPRGEGRGA